MKKTLLLLCLLSLFTQCDTNHSKGLRTNFTFSNNGTENTEKTGPKLMVGIVVDQMRYDYLVTFYNKYGKGGFKRLMREGYHLKNVHFNYIPTYTAVGHASIYTGTVPANHGIIGNDWYDKSLQKEIYCVDDTRYQTVGAKTGGEKSPHRMVTTTVTDQLKLAQNMRGKIIGISLKDRAAILPVGHTADAAYWFPGKDHGGFVTSTFYREQLPQWVLDFNASDKANTYLSQRWETLYDIDSYTETLPDNNPYETAFKGKDSPTFPYDLAQLRKDNDNFDLLKNTPFGNSIVTDFSLAAIHGENLGKTEATDFLSISYSSTDYIGHEFGVSSKELEDTYIRLDKELARLLESLDREVGQDNYTVFLTADHAVSHVPSYLQSLKIPAGYVNKEAFAAALNRIMKTHFNSTELIENVSNYQIFLNKKKIRALGLDQHKVAQTIVDEIIQYKDVYKAVTAHTLQNTHFDRGILQILQNGYNQKRSGDVLLVPYPGTTPFYALTGTTHGSGYNYDTHVPLIFYGAGVGKGHSNHYYSITDIAPTLSRILDITYPNGCTGRPIAEVLN